MSLVDACARFLGPIMAEYCRLIDEADPDTPMVVSIGGYEYRTTVRALKDLDEAYLSARDKADRAACARRDRKAAAGLFPSEKP